MTTHVAARCARFVQLLRVTMRVTMRPTVDGFVGAIVMRPGLTERRRSPRARTSGAPAVVREPRSSPSRISRPAAHVSPGVRLEIPASPHDAVVIAYRDVSPAVNQFVQRLLLKKLTCWIPAGPTEAIE